MKKTISFILLLSILFLSFTVKSQNQFGFFDIEQIFAIMPEAEQAQAKYEAEHEQVMAQFEEMQVNFNNLYQDFLNDQEKPKDDPEKWNKLIAEDKQLELMGIQERMQRFQMSAQENLQTRQIELLLPVYNKNWSRPAPGGY